MWMSQFYLESSFIDLEVHFCGFICIVFCVYLLTQMIQTDEGG